jgi:protoheme IX farnesyltransferase
MTDTVAPSPAAVGATSLPSRARQFYALTKPRVVQLIVFCAVIGMLMAVPGLPDLKLALAATAGIWLVAAAAAAFNCLVEQRIDARMARTAWRPTARGQLTNTQTLTFSALLCAAGSALLYFWVNPLTMWLTFATFVGYAIVYTVLLKPMTPQNIVIGGASGAMPPVLGWAAATGTVSAEALLLFLIIFVWTPPHFWALAIYRREDYARAAVPMLPVVYGVEFTRLHVLYYTILLFLVTLLPYLTRMSGPLYLGGAIVLGLGFLYYALRLQKPPSERFAMEVFQYSVIYLMVLFALLLADHYLDAPQAASVTFERVA